MKKFMLMAMVAFSLIGCGGNPPTQGPRAAEPYIILSSAVDPSINQLSISLRVDPPITEENVKHAVEMVIEKHKASYKSITVKSFAVSDASGLPYATSYFDGQSLSHHFNPQAAPQKIPSH